MVGVFYNGVFWGVHSFLLHYDSVLLEGVCLQKGYVDFPCLGALGAGV